jgi:hypothetical protein
MNSVNEWIYERIIGTLCLSARICFIFKTTWRISIKFLWFVSFKTGDKLFFFVILSFEKWNILSMLVFSVLKPCGPVGRYRRFGGTYWLHRQVRSERGTEELDRYNPKQLLIIHEGRGSMSLQNVSVFLQVHAALQPGRLIPTSAPLWKSHFVLEFVYAWFFDLNVADTKFIYRTEIPEAELESYHSTFCLLQEMPLVWLRVSRHKKMFEITAQPRHKIIERCQVWTRDSGMLLRETLVHLANVIRFERVFWKEFSIVAQCGRCAYVAPSAFSVTF